MIDETLINVLAGKDLNKLYKFDSKKYARLMEVIDSDDGRPTLNKVEYKIPTYQKVGFYK